MRGILRRARQFVDETGQAIKRTTPIIDRLAKAPPDNHSAEVQALATEWQQIMELTSNQSKVLNDMAMTAVRNIR
jgi:hypothetical protein